MYLFRDEELEKEESLTKCLDFEFLGFMPCSDKGNYFCVESPKGKFVPVLLGNYPYKWYQNDLEYEEKSWTLFFKGCDDGSVGLRFKFKNEALSWIDDQKEVDFYMIFLRWEEKGGSIENKQKELWVEKNVLYYN